MSGPFVRKNVLIPTATFTPADGVSTPSGAICVLNFNDLSGVAQQVELVMSATDATNLVWSCPWDSSAAGPGLVSWLIYSQGSVQAATQGEFTILANLANNI